MLQRIAGPAACSWTGDVPHAGLAAVSEAITTRTYLTGCTGVRFPRADTNLGIRQISYANDQRFIKGRGIPLALWDSQAFFLIGLVENGLTSR